MDIENFDKQHDAWTSQTLDVILHKVTKIDVLIQTQQRQELMLEKLTDAVSRLAIIEDRQNADRNWVKDIVADHKASVQKVSDKFEEGDRRISELERSDVENKRVRQVVFGLIGILGVAVFGAILKLLELK